MAGETLETKIKITGESSDAERAIVGTINELDKLTSDLKKPIGRIAAFEDATAGLDRLQASLNESKAKLAYFKDQASKAGAEGARVFASDIRAAEREVTRGNSAYNAAAVKLREMDTALKASGVDTRNLASEKTRLATAVANAERGTIKMKAALLEERSAAAGAAEKTRDAGNAAQKAGDQSQQSTGGVNSLAAGLKALAGAAVVREFISANASIESIGKSLEAVTGSAESAAAELSFIRGEATRLGVETASAASSFLTLAAATKGTNLEGQQTRDIWSAVASKMVELGASSADVSGAMIQLAQGASKGKFELEDLKSIAERIPGFFNIFSKAIGVTTAEFFDMTSKGQITADLLPKLASALGGTGGQIDTFNATLGRLKNTFSEVAVAIGDTGIFDAITFTLSKLADSVSFATLGFKGLAAGIRGDKEGLDQIRNQLEDVKNKLLGIKPAANDAAVGFTEMAAKASTAAVNIEQDISNKIAGSLIKLDGTIKTTEEAFKKLGIDPGEITRGISAAEREIIESFKKLAADPATNGALLTSALLVSLDKVSKESVPEIGLAYKAAANAGRQSADELAAGLNALNTKSQDLWENMVIGSKNAKAAASELESAFATLGITSQASLQKTAASAKDAYETIVNQGGTLADQSAAWAKYAEAAIAANGGVASSILQAEAAQHGLTIAIDDTGKASVRTKDALESMADAARRAADDVRGANTQAMEAAAVAASQARTSIGTMSESIGGFRQHIQEVGGALSGVINSARQDMFNLSESALAMYQSMDFGNAGESISMFLDDVAKNSAYVRMLFEQQTLAMEILQSRIATGTMTMRELDNASASLAGRFTVLGNEQLGPLRDAIADAQRRMLDLRDAAQSTLDGIQDEWDQLNNNLDEIERRRAEKREAEVRAQLAAAKAGGDREAIADLEKALSLLKQVTAARIEDAKQREKDANTSSNAAKTGGTATSGSSSHTVKITLPSGVSSTINAASAADATSLTQLLQQLANDKARA